MMIRNLLHSVIHNAVVTHVTSGWPVSLRIDPVLMRAAGLLPLEEVEIHVHSSGARLRTWVEPGVSGEVRVQGGHAAPLQAGGTISITAYAQLHAGQTLDHRAKIVSVDSTNTVVTITEAATALE